MAVKEKIKKRLIRNIDFKEFMEQIIEQRFAGWLICPRCGGKHIKKFGFDDRGNQRYSCKNCGTFIPAAKTVFANSKIPAGKWLKYAECMNRKYSLRKSAEIAEVSLKTAFNMRHKILEAIQQSMGIDELSGVVEMDETFFAESFKGNHKKGNSNWKAPRKSGKSRKRGKQVEYNRNIIIRMKKLIALVLALVCVLGLAGCSDKTANIDLPFEIDNVENVEMYHFVGAPVSAEKKVVVAEETIKTLYDMFEGLSLELKEVEETTGAAITSFRFNLADGTSYELIYGCYAVKSGNLKSSTGNFEYFTSADIGSYWSNIDLEAVSVEESELPQYNN